ALRRCRTRGTTFTGTENTTLLGWDCVTTTMPRESDGPTRLPGSTRRRPTMPVIGEVIRALATCRLAVPMRPCSDLTSASYCVTSDCCSVRSSQVMDFWKESIWKCLRGSYTLNSLA